MDFKNKIEIWLSSKSNKTKLITILSLLGICFITIASLASPKNNPKNKRDKTNSITINMEEYANQLEHKIDNMVKKIEGVGNSKVTITMESGVENIYAKSEKKSSNSNENLSGSPAQRNDIQRDITIIDGIDGKKQALTIKQLEPTVKGVVVVCEGAEDSLVAKRVIDAVSKALHIKANRLSVVKGNP